MSSRVGTAMPANPSTAWSSSAVGLTMSIQTALCGSAARSGEAIFFSEESEGTNTENMENSRTRHEQQEQAGDPTQQDLARFWQALHDRPPRICGGSMATTRLRFGEMIPLAQK